MSNLFWKKARNKHPNMAFHLSLLMSTFHQYILSLARISRTYCNDHYSFLALSKFAYWLDINPEPTLVPAAWLATRLVYAIEIIGFTVFIYYNRVDLQSVLHWLKYYIKARTDHLLLVSCKMIPLYPSCIKAQYSWFWITTIFVLISLKQRYLPPTLMLVKCYYNKTHRYWRNSFGFQAVAWTLTSVWPNLCIGSLTNLEFQYKF